MGADRSVMRVQALNTVSVGIHRRCQSAPSSKLERYSTVGRDIINNLSIPSTHLYTYYKNQISNIRRLGMRLFSIDVLCLLYTSSKIDFSGWPLPLPLIYYGYYNPHVSFKCVFYISDYQVNEVLGRC